MSRPQKTGLRLTGSRFATNRKMADREMADRKIREKKTNNDIPCLSAIFLSVSFLSAISRRAAPLEAD